MAAQGFDTWTLEVRGAGLSTLGVDFKEIFKDLGASFDSESPYIKIGELEAEVVSKFEEQRPKATLMDAVTRLSNKVSDFISGGVCHNLQSILFSESFYCMIKI